MDPIKEIEKFGFPLPPYRVVKTMEEAKEAAKEIGYPVVLKVWDPEKVSHKTDVGGVLLDIWTEEMLKESFNILKQRFPESPVLIQKQIKEGIELFIGLKKDPQFGHILAFGLGGIFIEVFRDVVYALCPIDKEEALQMIKEIKAKKILFGYRGKHVNIDKLAELLVKVSEFGIEEDVKEMDLNPVKADEQNVYVLDVRIIK
jgi:acyl-CoA synthetase (NDP forming)